jgi:hypothetical protein
MDFDGEEVFELGQEGDVIELPALGLETTFGADGYPILTKEILHHSLLSANYFPRLKARKTELPGIFSSSDFTPEVGAQLRGRDRWEGSRKGKGFGAVRYRQTRHEGSVRDTHIPHPWAHNHVVDTLMEGWDELAPLSLNKNSAIRPMVFRDGRVFVSSYSDGLEPEEDWHGLSEIGASDRANFDIKEFFRSIYTHTLVWTRLGRDYTQANLKTPVVKNHFATKLDEALKLSKRMQTDGLLVGPATSNLVAEYLLFKLDEKLREQFGDRFRRHIDDYTFYAESKREVRLFQTTLETGLSALNLQINPHKTRVETVDNPASPKWLVELQAVDAHSLDTPGALQAYWERARELSGDINAGMALRYGMRVVVRQAIRLNQPRWAASLLIKEIKQHQYLAPLLDEYMGMVGAIDEADLIELQLWLKNEFQILNSDSRSWILTTLGVAGLIDDELVDLVISELDVVPMCVAHEFRKDKADLFSKAVRRDREDPRVADEYWLLAYQLFLHHGFEKDGDGVFEVLKLNQVSFVKPLN